MTVEQAYEKLARSLLEFIAENGWVIAGSNTKILGRMTQTSYWRKSDGKLFENDRLPSLDAERSASQAILLLRDDFLATTGERIWGLTFTLYPDGKFNIEYDYNKPEDYEDTDETITLEEAMKNLPMANERKE